MPETDAQFTPPPGWGAPLPPEKPRIDAPAALPQDALPTAASVAAASFTGDDLVYDFSRENRRGLDGRRAMAYLIDEILVFAVAAGVYYALEYSRITMAVILLGIAFRLSYYFVCESLWGRTIGKAALRLRVVRADGRGAPAAKIAGRTIFRLIEDPVIAILAMCATGKRRQRIGDVAAGTVVRNDDRPFVRAPESPLLVVYPLVWIAGALLAVPFMPDDALFHGGRSDNAYMVKIDRICEKRNRMAKALGNMNQTNMLSVRTLLRQEERKIEKLGRPPREVRRDVAEVRRIHRDLNREIDRTIADVHRTTGDPTPVVDRHAAILEPMLDHASERFRALGVPACQM